MILLERPAHHVAGFIKLSDRLLEQRERESGMGRAIGATFSERDFGLVERDDELLNQGC